MKAILAAGTGATIFFAGFLFAQILIGIHCSKTRGFVVGTEVFACENTSQLKGKTIDSAGGKSAGSHENDSI